MKNIYLKPFAVALLALGLAAGCASTPEPVETGPSAEELAAQQAAEEAARENAEYLAQAQELLDEISKYTNLTADQQARLEEGRMAIANNEGRKAYEILSALLAELQAASTVYSVVPGDNLWNISGKGSVYGNPYMWPLIYKNNSGAIEDPDLIYPDQRFDIKSHPMQGEVDAAVEHAKNRGAWSLGQPESSDQDYLSGY
ncbi:MAG TPA: hypothetical protein VFP95_00280 [Gammaproteobacteria bacterium]|nr:hypothetical protein [Gammaproteobacteria bacterium]